MTIPVSAPRIYTATAQLRPLTRPAPSPAHPPATPATTVRLVPLGPRPTESTCRACEWFAPAPEGTTWCGRCAHPTRRICTSSAARLRPWLNLPFCPVSTPAR